MTNIAEILNDAPKGLKLYSLVLGEVTLQKVDTAQENYQIEVIDKNNNNSDTFTKYGKLFKDYDDAECILFPSKEHKSWDNWQEVLFKVGDVVTCTKDINQKDKTFIITGIGGNFIALNNNKNLSHNNTSLLYRYATPEEREQFFNELKNNGYKWNAYTKQIEKIEQQYTHKYDCSGYEGTITEEEQFTIDDFKPTQFVLVRDWTEEKWNLDIFSFVNESGGFVCVGEIYGTCIPYNDETKHLLGTTDDCPNKYKTW